MKVLAITQARCGSTRLPFKVLKEIKGKSLLQIHLERIQQSKLIDKLVVATTTNPEDIKICQIAKSLNVACFRGSENDVLDRFYQTAQQYQPEFVVRLTSDCPLIDAELIDEVISLIKENAVDYCSNVLMETFPDGQDVEVFKFKALEKAWKEATLTSEREHVTPYIHKNTDFKGGHLFKALNYSSDGAYGNIRLTVDEQIDFDVIEILIDHLGADKEWKSYANYLLRNDIAKNTHITRNEGYYKSLKQDKNEQ